MNDNINSLTKIEEEILNYDISDEALETVAGGGEGEAWTHAFCTGFVGCPGCHPRRLKSVNPSHRADLS